MNEAEQALTEAVAQDLWHSDANERWVVRSTDDNAEEWRLHKDFYNSEGYDPFGFFPAFMLARKALTTIRQHDEQAALNCGHCTPNADEIACGCQIEERDDE